MSLENRIIFCQRYFKRVKYKLFFFFLNKKGRIVQDGSSRKIAKFVDQSKRNFVDEVSVKAVKTYNPNGYPRICAVDCGLKLNQIRCFLKRGARVDVVPWDHKLNSNEYDGLFLSNGPGN